MMSWNEKNRSLEGMTEQGFQLEVNNQNVPGVYWKPENEDGKYLVLLGHGGSASKTADYIVNVARLLASRGISSMAIDGPGHGERATQDFGTAPDAFSSIWEEGGGTAGMLADWAAALDFIEAETEPGAIGWWGLSMGTMMGLPVVATDKRISVALLGLMGNSGPNAADLMRYAPEVTIPVRFLVQWDDEIVPRDTCLELFSELATKKKTLHASPGKHAAVPQFEIQSSVDFLSHRLKK
jgi:dienelactone hydrolase